MEGVLRDVVMSTGQNMLVHLEGMHRVHESLWWGPLANQKHARVCRGCTYGA